MRSRLLYSLLILLPILCIGVRDSQAQKDSILLTPTSDGLCAWSVTILNRNPAQTPIDGVSFQLTSANGSALIWAEAAPGSQWAANVVDDYNISFTATVGNIPPGGSKKIGYIIIDIPTALIDKEPVVVVYRTKTGNDVITSTNLAMLCTVCQSNIPPDQFSVTPFASGTDPGFNFKVMNRNAFAVNIDRFRVDIASQGAGTMRPSKVKAPATWVLDSVTPFSAFFTSTQGGVPSGSDLDQFNVVLRGNPQVNTFNFSVESMDYLSVAISRDTLRGVKSTFSGSAAEVDSVSVVNQAGCLYEMTVKNFHVSNTTLPSRIRSVVLFSKSAGVKFDGAPTAPTGWTKVISSNGDTITYSAPSEAQALPSGIVSNMFKFSVTGSEAGKSFDLGWKTFRSPNVELSTGSISQQCAVEAPVSDTAWVESPVNCAYKVTIINRHNTPPSDVRALELSIPANGGKIVSPIINPPGWTVGSQTDQKIRFVAPEIGPGQATNTSQDILFLFEPTTPGADVNLTWSTYSDEATVVGTGILVINCSPIVEHCDTATSARETPGECLYNYTINNARSTAVNRVSFEVKNGWSIDNATAPAGWTVQLQSANTIAEFTPSAEGIAPSTTLSGFKLSYEAINQGNTFAVTTKTYDANAKECVENFTYENECQSVTESVAPPVVISSSVSVRPNPATESAMVSLGVVRNGHITITVLDELGKHVRSVVSTKFAAGEYELPLDLRGLSAGAYYIRIQTEAGVITKKLIVIQ